MAAFSKKKNPDSGGLAGRPSKCRRHLSLSMLPSLGFVPHTPSVTTSCPWIIAAFSFLAACCAAAILATLLTKSPMSLAALHLHPLAATTLLHSAQTAGLDLPSLPPFHIMLLPVTFGPRSSITWRAPILFKRLCTFSLAAPYVWTGILLPVPNVCPSLHFRIPPQDAPWGSLDLIWSLLQTLPKAGDSSPFTLHSILVTSRGQTLRL